MTMRDAPLIKEENSNRVEITFGPFRLCAAERLIERSGEPLQLGGRAMDILIALVERAGEVVSHRELINRIWSNVTADDGNLRFHVGALRRALGDGRDGARYVVNIPGRGYSFVGSTARSQAGESAPAPIRQAVAVHSLPSRLKRMVGRQTAVEAIAAQLARRRFVTIVGPGGIGKTTVAIAVCHAIAAEYGGACFVDLGPLADPRLIPSLLATALGLIVQSDNPTRDLIDFLREKRMLLILDGCEHVIETAARLVETIYDQADGVHVLATSREALRIEGEQVHYLAPLECPPVSDMLTAAESLAFPAAQLFSDQVVATSDCFVLQDGDAPVVARICRKLDGIALAIELAAGRVNAHGIEGVDALLDSKLSLLWQGRRTAPPRHHTLNAAIEWSYELLTDIERTILRRLAVFAGPFSLEAAQAVADDSGTEAGEFTEVVAQLVAKSLIVSDARDGRGARYRVLDTTRTYLQTKLASTDEADMVARRHAEFFCSLLRRVSAQAPASAEARRFPAYGGRVGNVRSALEWCFSERGDVSLGVALAAAAAPLFLEMSLLTECRRWTGTALAAYAATGGDPQREMELQASSGLSRLLTEGNSVAVCDTLKRALDLAEGLSELSTQLQVLSSLHLFHSRIADFRGSVGLAERALDVAAKLGDPTGLAVAESMLGTSHHLIGDQASALIHCRSAVARPAGTMRLDIARCGFDHRIRALGPLAQALWLCGAVDEAANTARCAVSEAEVLEHPVTLCISLIYTGFVFLWRGEWSVAEPIVERLSWETEKYSLAPFSAVAMGFRGDLAVRRGQSAAAIPVLMSCLETMRLERHQVFASAFISGLAEAMAMVGRLDEALKTIEEAISEVEGKGGSYHLPEMWRLKGHFLLSRDSSNAAEAEECFLRSLDLARRQGALSWELRAATAMARLRVGLGRVEEAREELASTFGRFAQGKETVDLRAAAGLLDELA
jgi:predicted ATPase/DNA-binding winged helix-turn-helix (wHTH) protein